MGRDLIERPYGRFFHLPTRLAAHGHEVTVALLSYQAEPALDEHRNGVRWVSEGLAAGGLKYLKRVRSLVKELRPDWIVGFSDTYFGIIAAHLARKNRARCLIDAYDNYEAYIPWCKPLHAAWRRALRSADAVSIAGPSLAELAGRSAAAEDVLVAPMAVDPVGFEPLPRDECRTRLGLPRDAALVGYFGAIHPNRGISLLFEAFEVIAQAMPGIRLVLSGRLGKRVKLPPDVIWLGYLPDEQVPMAINAMNVVTVINRDSAFGRYSHPIKLYEAMSCRVPVVASRTPATEWILRTRRELLVEPGSSTALAAAVLEAIKDDRIDYEPPPTWDDVAGELEQWLQRM